MLGFGFAARTPVQHKHKQRPILITKIEHNFLQIHQHDALWFQHRSRRFKEALVRGIFDSVASSYDIMNDAMSFGVHRLWKDSDSFISLLRPGSKGHIRCIDVAGGTGDIALRILGPRARNSRRP